MQRDETDGERQKDSEYNIKAEDLERQKRKNLHNLAASLMWGLRDRGSLRISFDSWLV